MPSQARHRHIMTEFTETSRKPCGDPDNYPVRTIPSVIHRAIPAGPIPMRGGTVAGDGKPGLRYLRVADALKQKILHGIYQPGERLRSQYDLARDHGVAFATLKQSLDILEREGYIVRRPGEAPAPLSQTD